MKVLIVCKASQKIGMGHLIRSKTFATDLIGKAVQIEMIVIGGKLVNRLIQNLPFPVQLLDSENELEYEKSYDITFLDMLTIEVGVLEKIRANTKLAVSLSPIFDRMKDVDLFFNRSKYYDLEINESTKTYAGLEYALISDHCLKIPTSIYEYNLNQSNFPIAISMGGGDAANKTLDILNQIKHCNVPATFWVMLGEGYSHSYNDLINVIKKDTNHEIILAKANKSMWQVLRNCILAILPGGITTYEAAFAGLPTINLLEISQQEFLIKELVEEKVACLFNGMKKESFSSMNQQIEYYFNHKKELMRMHINSKDLIDKEGSERIFNTCLEYLKEISYA